MGGGEKNLYPITHEAIRWSPSEHQQQKLIAEIVTIASKLGNQISIYLDLDYIVLDNKTAIDKQAEHKYPTPNPEHKIINHTLNFAWSVMTPTQVAGLVQLFTPNLHTLDLGNVLDYKELDQLLTLDFCQEQLEKNTSLKILGIEAKDVNFNDYISYDGSTFRKLFFFLPSSVEKIYILKNQRQDPFERFTFIYSNDKIKIYTDQDLDRDIMQKLRFNFLKALGTEIDNRNSYGSELTGLSEFKYNKKREMYTINFKAYISVDNIRSEKDFTKTVTLETENGAADQFRETCTKYLKETQLHHQLVHNNGSRVVFDNAGSKFSFELGNGFNSKHVLFLPVKDPSEIHFETIDSIKEVVFKQPIWCYQLGEFKSLKRITSENLKTLVQNKKFESVEKIYINCYAEAPDDDKHCYNFKDVQKIIQGTNQKSNFEVAVYVHDYELRGGIKGLDESKNISFNYLSETPKNVHQFITRFFTENDFEKKIKNVQESSLSAAPVESSADLPHSFAVELGNSNKIIIKISKDGKVKAEPLQAVEAAKTDSSRMNESKLQKAFRQEFETKIDGCELQDVDYLITNHFYGSEKCQLFMVSDFDCTITDRHLYKTLRYTRYNKENGPAVAWIRDAGFEDEKSKELAQKILNNELNFDQNDVLDQDGLDLLSSASDFCLAVMGGKERAERVIQWIQSFDGNFCISSKGRGAEIYRLFIGIGDIRSIGRNIDNYIKYIHGNNRYQEPTSYLNQEGNAITNKTEFIGKLKTGDQKSKTVKIGYIDDDDGYYNELRKNPHCVDCFTGPHNESGTGIDEAMMKETQEWYQKYKPRKISPSPIQ
jgi:hypothetical protein